MTYKASRPSSVSIITSAFQILAIDGELILQQDQPSQVPSLHQHRPQIVPIQKLQRSLSQTQRLEVARQAQDYLYGLPQARPVGVFQSNRLQGLQPRRPLPGRPQGPVGQQGSVLAKPHLTHRRQRITSQKIDGNHRKLIRIADQRITPNAAKCLIEKSRP
jgi:hypothetical protein